MYIEFSCVIHFLCALRRRRTVPTLCEGNSLHSQANFDLLHCSGNSSNSVTSSEDASIFFKSYSNAWCSSLSLSSSKLKFSDSGIWGFSIEVAEGVRVVEKDFWGVRMDWVEEKETEWRVWKEERGAVMKNAVVGDKSS